MPERFLTIEEVIDRVCFSKTHIYRMIAEGRFPRQVKLGPQKAAYTRAVGRIAMLAAVRRIRQPGCKFDEMLILESKQGQNKSTALRILAVNEEWFSDDLPLHVDSKRQIEALQGHWIIEAGELNGMRKGDVDSLKSFLSRAVDKARKAYDRMVTIAPRHSIIIGTTNSDQYLKDSTGNRRYWPVKVGQFDVDALRRDRDQLWAEAAAREAKDESIRLDPELYAAAQEEQEKRRLVDPFVAALERVIGDRLGKIQLQHLWAALDIPTDRRTPDLSGRLADAMVQLGFERTKLRFGGKPEWCYARGSKVERMQQIVIDGYGSAASARLTGDGHSPAAGSDSSLPEGEDKLPF